VIDDVDVEYFTIDYPGWTCSEFIISTAEYETFAAASVDGVNFTLDDNPDVCLFYLSSAVCRLPSSRSHHPGHGRLRHRAAVRLLAVSQHGAELDILTLRETVKRVGILRKLLVALERHVPVNLVRHRIYITKHIIAIPLVVGCRNGRWFNRPHRHSSTSANGDHESHTDGD
jgi:hypothetical protein